MDRNIIVSFMTLPLKELFNKGSQRSILVKKNIIGNFFTKGLNVIISLLYVPITLDLLNPTRYGIWMTLTSLIAWISVFDIGLGNGLRNKLTEALTLKDFEKAKKYISTTYALLSIIVISVLIIFLVVNHWISWSYILNTSPSFTLEINQLVVFVAILFGLRFVLNTITTIFIANQQTALGSFIETMGNLLGLIAICGLAITHHTSLFLFGIVAMLAPVLIYILTTVFFFRTKFKFIQPSIKYIDFSHAKELAGLGVQFFVIQIAALIIFQTSNLLISHFFSPEEVTPYNIVFKYFSILTLAWSIIIAPLWSAFTQAVTLNDFTWIKSTLIKLNRLALITICVIILMVVVAKPIISIWTNNQISTPSTLLWIFGVYTFISVWNNIYAFFLNGISATKVQIITSIFASIIHIPLAIFFVRYCHFGSEGVVLSMSISLSFFAIAGPLHTYKLISNNGK
jgi:O-antigen/teichoic acid export membrane protein